ncbi:ACT domain-containing protein [Myxococcota bacterium]
MGSFWTSIVDRVASDPRTVADANAATSRLQALAETSTVPAEAQPLAADILVHLVTGAPFLCRLLAHDPEALTWLTSEATWSGNRAAGAFAAHLVEHLCRADEAAWMRSARRFRAREIARIAARDLMGLASVEETTAELSRLADCCLNAACSFAHDVVSERYGELGGPSGFAVVGLGKLGAFELNFSSDIDLLFVYGDDGETGGGSQGVLTNLEWAVMATQTVVRLLDRPTEDGRLFRVDLRLRPDGASGPVAFTPEWARRYYAKKGQAWERVALLRARHCAGDRGVTERFLLAAEPFVYRREVDTELVSSLREVKRLITEALESKRKPGFDVKLGSGGIRELEFFVQTLQLLNAGRKPELRQNRTLALIDRLLDAGLIDEKLRDSLVEDYCFLRRLEHRLQMIDDQHTHLLPRDDAARRAIAGRMGYGDLETFDEWTEGVREGIHLLFQSVFAEEETGEEAQLRRRTADAVAGREGIDHDTARVTLAEWPVEHLEHQSIEAIADGFALLDRVTDEEPVAARVVDLGDGRHALRLAGQDRTGLASVSTGVLAGAGMDIEEGRLFTLPAHQTANRQVGARAMQYLVVRPPRGQVLDDTTRRELTDQIRQTARRWLHGDTEEVRAEVNARWVERMQTARAGRAQRMGNIDLEIDNRSDPDATIVSLWAEDAPGFLCGFTQALAMRGINVHQTRIRTERGRVMDRFHLTDRHGRKIITLAARHELEVLAVLIKAFSHFLSRAADPARALTQFDALLDRLEQEGVTRYLDALATEPLLATLATVLGSGSHLFEDFLRLNPIHMLPVLEAISSGTRAAMPAPLRDGALGERRAKLIAWRDAEIFRIDCEHLMHRQGSLEFFSEDLTRLAERFVKEAWRVATEEVAESLGWPMQNDGSPVPWAILALGKFGGRELGVASDLELMVVFGQDGATAGPHPTTAGEFFERAVQSLRRNMPARRDGIFELDLRLRPHGSHGPLASSLASFESYYCPDGGAAPYERQALIRMVPCAGDANLGEQACRARDRFTYGPEPLPLDEVLAIRQKQIRELTNPDAAQLKFSPGGLVELEYTVQYLQVEHGCDQPRLREPNTMRALDALEQCGMMPPTEAEELRDAYGTLRRVIDALRLERGNARDLTLPRPNTRDAQVLARRLGASPDGLFAEVADHMAKVTRQYRARLGGSA